MTVIQAERVLDLSVVYVVDWVAAVRRLEKGLRPPPPKHDSDDAVHALLKQQIEEQTRKIVSMKEQLSTGWWPVVLAWVCEGRCGASNAQRKCLLNT